MKYHVFILHPSAFDFLPRGGTPHGSGRDARPPSDKSAAYNPRHLKPTRTQLEDVLATLKTARYADVRYTTTHQQNVKVRNGEVDWRPAVDPNRILTIIGLVVVAFLITRPRMVKARAKALARREAAA